MIFRMMKTSSSLMFWLFSMVWGITFAEVVIENNGYRGLVVVIHEDTPENPLLLESIKEMIIRASPRLYMSTKQRAYFEAASIVVPSTWSMSPEYKPVPNHDYMNSAEVRVAPPHPNYKNIPYTLQLGECGERGQYIHLTPEFLLEISPNTNKPKHRRNSKIFLHEWAHFRYGVFNEYGEKGNPKSPIFYKDKNDRIRPNGCSINIVGRIRRSDGKTPCIVDINKNLINDCTFYPDMQTGMNNESGKASPMYMPELDSADEFCDRDSVHNTHNPSAPNMQNRMCNTRSVLEVVLDNEDFKDQKNLPRGIKSLATNITVIQLQKKASPKFVLLMDVSGSMNGEPLKQLQEATSRFIKYHIKDACNITLGLVSFNGLSSILAEMTPVNNSTRTLLIDKIPKNAGGYTGIGGGILKAIELLGKNGESTVKSKIILLSDGEENRDPLIKDVTPQIVRSGVQIYTLAFGNQASKHLEQLSKLTGVKGDYYNPTLQDKSLDSILNTMISDSCDELLPIMNANRAIMVAKNLSVEGVFDVEKDLESTVVFMSYSYPKTKNYNGIGPVVTITDPRGKIFNQQSPEYTNDENLHSIQFKIPRAQPGKHKYRLENPGHEDLHLNLMITSDSGKLATNDQPKGKPIRVKSWISNVNITYPHVAKVFAEVMKDCVPVVKASVTATGYRPDGNEEKIVLNDNGKGADMHANDGVYTEYFTRYNGDGRYSIDVNVENTEDTRLYTGFDYSPARAPVLPILPSEVKSEEPQADFSLNDLQQVNEVFETSAIYNADSNKDPDFNAMEPVDDFKRFDSAGTFILHEWTSKDLISPSRITDLTIVATNFSARSVHIEWTSPGDDMSDGQAESVNLLYHHDPVVLLRSFEKGFSDYEILNGSLKSPLAYEKHWVILRLPSEDVFSIVNSSRNVYFAARAVDEAGNLGIVSNAAIADFPTQEKLQPEDNTYIYAIVIAAIAGIVIIAIILGYILYSKRKQHSKLID